MPIARIGLWVVTLAALSMLLKTWWLAPIPGFWLSIGWGGLLMWVIAGVTFPRWEVFADLLWRAPEGERGMVLTIDGMVTGEQLTKLLGTLERAAVSATFFVDAESDASAVHQIVSSGHRLGLRASGRSSTRGRAMKQALEQLIGRVERADAVLRVARPTRRWLTPAVADAARRARVTLVGASAGWPRPVVADRLAECVRDGALLCVTATSLAQDADLVRRLLAVGVERGVEWTSLEKWLPSEKAG
jgi:hypothetical protein